MANEVILGAIGLSIGVIFSMISAAVLFGRLFQRVDTLEKDLNNAFTAIRDINQKEKK